jgi:hypothetical protein
MENLTHQQVKKELKALRLLWKTNRFQYRAYLVESKLKHFAQCRASGAIIGTTISGLHRRTESYYPSAVDVAQSIFEDSKDYTWAY